MTKGFFFTTCLAVFMILGCDRTEKFDSVKLEDYKLEDQSSLDKNAQVDFTDIEEIYGHKCSICHGENGVSIIKSAPDLASSTLSVEERVAIILYGRGTMPPQKDVLDMSTIRGLAVYLDTFE
ncbi:MAG: c-type cytochrome [Flavobacteriales bacterium]|jgi:mono/diheme cytochrome c family protein|tara:strand:- start:39 stop:407 length:369 start_codon:yes stop_codon:yes gene_type:complete